MTYCCTWTTRVIGQKWRSRKPPSSSSSINIEQQQLNLANQENQLKRKVELHRVKMISGRRHRRRPLRRRCRPASSCATAARASNRRTPSCNQSKERLAKTTIRAPIGGTITALAIKVGETAVASQVAIAGSSLMTIANTSTMMTEVNVDEADIAKIVLGQEVAIHTAAYPDTPLKGEVAIDSAVAQADAGLAPGGRIAGAQL